MPYNILTIPEFDKNTKTLAKRYKLIKQDLQEFIKELKDNPRMGTLITNNCYKVRLANSSIPTGKSKGFRVITYYIDENSIVYLLTIYSKSDKSTVTDNELKDLLNQIK